MTDEGSSDAWAPGHMNPQAGLLLDALREELSTLVPYFDLMREHLDGAVQDTEAGVMAVVGRIDTVNGLSADQVSRIQQSMKQCLLLVEVTRQQSGCNQQVIVLVQTEVEAHLEKLAKNKERTQLLATDVRELAKTLEVITDISGQTHLLAINAAIQATHAGKAGAAFAVIAAEVKTLSLLTAKAAKEIGVKINHLSERMLGELVSTDKEAAGVQATADELRKIVEAMNATQVRYRVANDDLQALMGSIQVGNQDVVVQLTETLGHLQFQDVLRQRVEQVGEALKELGEHASHLVRNLGDPSWNGTTRPSLKERLSRHGSNYVMASQRLTHAKVLGGPSTGAMGRPAIELF